MKKILLILLGLFFNYFVSQNLTDTENYVYKKTHLTDPSDPIQKQLESVQYLDGLGRPKQVISIKSTPLGQDMVVPIIYDQFGRKTKDYLPVPVQTTNAGIQTAVTENTVNSYYGVTNAFSESELESSPLSRIFQSAHQGEEWKMSSGHTIKYAYDANSTDDQVKKYQVTTTWDNTNQIYQNVLSSIALYDENTLYKFSVKDEDNNEKIVFKDPYGHIILIRKNDGIQNLDTYYVYDSNDHIAYVIPPLASILSSLTPTILSNLCYQYLYDNKNRLVEKKLPGKGWEYMVYDKTNRPIMTQDAILKGQGKWLITKYDQFGRVAYTGFLGSGGERAARQDEINNLVITESRNATGFTRNGMTVYYTDGYFAGEIPTILSVNYYDTYPTGSSAIPTQVLGQNVLSQDAQNSNSSTKSFPTASYVKNIEDDNWSRNYIWYDKKGRAIGSHSINHLGGYTKTESELDFAGTPKQLITRHKRLDSDTERVITETFTYDNQNRLKVHRHKVDNNPEEILAQNEYNELSQLKNKKVGGASLGNGLQSIDYAYNIRGWMTKINDPANLNGNLFGYEIKYRNPSNSSATPKYNGNIAEIDWKTANGNVLKRYYYQYDGLDRLKDAIYEEPSTTLPPTNSYGESLTYDVNGNIKTLKRFSAAGTTPLMIDNLDYNTYDGNQLITVNDLTNNSTGYPSGGNPINYDVNGNMTSMLDKRIKQIDYNFLNLPNNIQMNAAIGAGYNLSHTYKADGTKLIKQYTKGTTIFTTNYLDGFQYEHTSLSPTTSALKFVPTSEGFYSFENNRYIYQYKDQVGNIRVSFYKDTNGNIEIDDAVDFYPFGLEHDGIVQSLSTPSYKYSFQSQEKQVHTGWNSFKWRNYDPSIGRFFNIDPLSEEYSYQSHYNFSENRVVDAIELEGLEAYILNDQGDMSINGYGLSHTEYTKGSDGTFNIAEVNLTGKANNQNSSSSLNNMPSNCLVCNAPSNLVISLPPAQYAPITFDPSKYCGHCNDGPVKMMGGPGDPFGIWEALGMILGSSDSNFKYAVVPLMVVKGQGDDALKVLNTEKFLAVEKGAFSINKHGNLTDGMFTVSRDAMLKHKMDLGIGGKSIFYPTLNADEAVLKAAKYAEKNNLWIYNGGTKAKVPVLNTNIGTLGNRQPTNFINVYKNANNVIHGAPGTPK